LHIPRCQKSENVQISGCQLNNEGDKIKHCLLHESSGDSKEKSSGSRTNATMKTGKIQQKCKVLTNRRSEFLLKCGQNRLRKSSLGGYDAREKKGSKLVVIAEKGGEKRGGKGGKD